jgi:tripartite-type tricarboxylate transporter receptor subunit TctC
MPTGIFSSCALALFGLFLSTFSVAHAAEGPNVKNVEMIVANTAGGGYDQYARVVARHMGRHLPGKPILVVRNMPGAGGVRAANHLANIAPRDGSVIALFTREVALAPLLAPSPSAYQFKAEDFNWIGSPQQDLGLMIVNSKSRAQTLDEMKRTQTIMSGTGPGSGPTTFPLVLNDVLGTKLKVVAGYPGSQEALLAVENGEVDGHVSGGSSAAFRARVDPMVERGSLKVLLQLGMTKDPAYLAPLALDVVTDPRDRQLLELVFTPQYLGRPIAAPPGVPAAIVDALRRAFQETMRDPEFVAEAGAQKLDLNPVTGQQIAEVLQRVYALPEAMIGRVIDLNK